MSRSMLVGCLLLLPCANLAHGQKQEDRNKRDTPGLVVETGARRGACDVLTFTADGKYLLATGDDKVVRMWPVTKDGVDANEEQVLRWPIYREQRGGIYAMAISPDQRRIVVGGYGTIMGMVALLSLPKHKDEPCKVEKVLIPEVNVVNWSLAFSPSGKQVLIGKDNGSIWLWDVTRSKASEVGTHPAPNPTMQNRVRLVVFIDEENCLSVARDGTVHEWDLTQPRATLRRKFRFEKIEVLSSVGYCPQAGLLVAGGEGRTDNGALTAHWVEMRSTNGGQPWRPFLFPLRGHHPSSFAFDQQGRWLAIGVRIIQQQGGFTNVTGGRVFLYDPKNPNVPPLEGPRLTNEPQEIAFHPDGTFLAVAGGDNDEVVLWDLRKQQFAASVQGPARALWSAAFSADEAGRYFGYCPQRKATTAHPNDQGDGAWQVFDLKGLKWAPGKVFRPVAPLETAGGWRVQLDLDTKRQDLWYVVNAQGQKFVLPINRDRYVFPTCYTFLDEPKDKPPRLVVGHYWGMSLFELHNDGPHLVRLFAGHDRDVTAVAPSPDQKSLITASRDQTINIWSLADWPGQPELGAEFVEQGGKVLVRSVEPGCPAWEAGLTPGDEVIVLAVNVNQFLYDPEKKREKERVQYGIKAVGGAAACLERLRQPVPGKELYFEVRRAGEKKPIMTLTTVRQRPALRFLPLSNGEWVLWRWRDFYYATSTHGDSFIGWHVNGKEAGDTPAFYRAEQFRDQFHKPDRIKATVKDLHAKPERLAFADIEPPQVNFAATKRDVRDDDVTTTLSVTPHGEGKDQKVKSVSLWINDYLFKSWNLDQGDVIPAKVTIPRKVFRLGLSELTVQAFNAAGGRGEAKADIIFSSDLRPPGNLYVLAVGVNDYEECRKRSKDPINPTDLDGAVNDAKAIGRIFENQKESKRFRDAKVVPLYDKQVTKEAVLRAMKNLTRDTEPDDLFVLFLGGHGTADPERPGSFTYVPANCDLHKLKETGLTGGEMYAVLQEARCCKLLLFDACHSGDASSSLDVLREMRRNGIGPFVFAACDRDQEAFEYEDPNTNQPNGFFTYALLQATGPAFAEADKNKSGNLDARELFNFVEGYVRVQLEVRNRKQNPRCSPLELLPLLRVIENRIGPPKR